jgi:pimeloyl-ACP methyl ester carboxylesterase/DNA-binding CsgD family transcriptional regulator
MEPPIRQTVRYLRTPDGVRLAWAEAGRGPVLVKAANWMTHLEYDLESPVWRHWIRFLAGHFHTARYDERGCGLTDRSVAGLSQELWVGDLEAVVDAVAPGAPVILLGISQGSPVCIDFAVRHPERVSHLVLYGGYARGVFCRENPKAERICRAVIELSRLGWGSEGPAFRQLFTSWFIPGGTEEQLAWYNELCRRTVSGEMAARLLEARAPVDVTDRLALVRCPTLVLHARRDAITPFEEGRRLAAGIPGAQFVELDSRNHVLLEGEPAWGRFRESILDFTGVKGPGPEDPAFSALSAREREVLALLAEGLSNREVGQRLDLQEKTVRNHVSNLFDKLGVWSRAQAIVLARDRGFRA